MGILYLVRHGRTESNLISRYAGRSPEPLTADGRKQVAELGERLRCAGIQVIRSSEVRRAMETAEVLSGALGVPVVPDSRLNEMLMGPWEGLTESEVARRYPAAYRLWLQRPDQVRLDGRESLTDLAQRVELALRDTDAGPPHKLAVTHVALIRVMVLGILGLPLRLYKAVRVDNADCLVVDPRKREITRLGTSSSLRDEIGGAGGPTVAE